jgi:hypothetical protein
LDLETALASPAVWQKARPRGTCPIGFEQVSALRLAEILLVGGVHGEQPGQSTPAKVKIVNDVFMVSFRWF